MKSEVEKHDLPRFADLEAEYELLRELGRGGTAVVYLARERELDRKVAIKVIRATFVEDEEAAARLAREAYTVGSLQHPNIVALYGTRRLRDLSLALIMQYVPGRTLKQEIQSAGALPFAQVAGVLADVGSALACAQRHRIVHRDIKPENVYIDDETGIARLSDFGIARPWDRDSGLTLPGMAIGTPAYMSPEQIDGGELDGRSDLYSLGLVGYEMLTGRAPWAGESLFSTIYKQKHEELPPLNRVRPGIPPSLRRALEGALRKDREERWYDAEEFLAALTGRISKPSRRGARVKVPAAPAAPPKPVDTATIQYRRSDVRASDSKPVDIEPVSPDRLAPLADESADNHHDDVAGIVPYGVLPAELIADPEVAPAVPGYEWQFARWLSPYMNQRRTLAVGIVVPILLVTVLITALTLRDDAGPPLGVPATAAAAATKSANLGSPKASGPPVLAYALYGDRQTGPAGDTLRQLLVVQVEAAGGQPAVGATVQFSVAAGAGTVIPQTTKTDASGVASAKWVLQGPGEHVVYATVVGMGNKPTTFTAIATTRRPARMAAVSPTLLTGTLGAVAPSPLIVSVVDDRGEPIPDVKVDFAVRSGDGRIQSASTVTGPDGLASAEWVLGQEGPQEVIASVANLPSVVFRATSAEPLVSIRRGIATGGMHTCALSGDGAADCWGGNSKGQLGDGSSARRASPVRVGTAEPLAGLSAGVAHTCGVGVSGKVFCWGANASGQLGDGTTTDRPEPVAVELPAPASRVFAGAAHSCALDTAGRLFCWGQNNHGQLGDDTRTSRLTPVRAGGNLNFRRVALGWAHTCALTGDGTAYCWGRNTSGELGDGGTADRPTAGPASTPVRFAAIAAGSGHTCALTATGRILCWGQNSYGQLGNGSTENSPVPVEVLPTDPFASLALGSVHSCALTREGAARCWGRNTYGQIGDGTNEDRPRPTPVAGTTRFSALYASGAHTCGTAGAASYCWGYNAEGQLGSGTRNNQNRPVAVGRQ